MLRDASIVASVAYRMELEALALIPTVVVQAIRSAPRAGSELTTSAEASVHGALQVSTIPAAVSAAKERMGRQVDVLKTLATVLSRRTDVPLDATAGFLTRDSLVDEVVGLGLDSFRFQVEGGAEIFAFAALASETRSQDNDGNAYDYTGRLRKTEYSVEPIFLARAKARLLFDYFRLPGAGERPLGTRQTASSRAGAPSRVGRSRSSWG